MGKNVLSEVHNELCQRGYDVELIEMFKAISFQGGLYKTTMLFAFDDDDASWNGAKIMSNRIEINKSFSLAQRLFICNQFNKQSEYCSAYLSDDDNECFMVSACVSSQCKNFVEMCANMFEEVIEETDFLIDLISEY